jgi:hypothetical protein
MYAMGFSINTVSLLAMVLAIGIVVDDAIVVVEAVEAKMAANPGMSPAAAASAAMGEITGAILAITLVLLSVFVPVAFIPGISGQLFQQFAVTVSVAMVISAINALTLAPALCAIILPPHHGPKKGVLGWISRRIDSALRGDRAGFQVDVGQAQGGERVLEISYDAFGFVVFQKKKGDRGHQTGGCRDGESAKIFRSVGRFGMKGQGVKAGETHRTADEIDKGDHPTQPGGKLCEDDLEHEECGGDSEGDHIGERIEFPSECAFVSAQAGNPAVQHVENECAENPKEACLVMLDPSTVIRGLKKAPLNDLENGHKTAEEVSRRHQARKKIGNAFAGGGRWTIFYAGHRARMVWPPTTR